MPMLLCAKQVSGAAYFQIAHGNFKACAKFSKIADGLQTLFGNFTKLLVAPVHKISVRQARRTAYPAAHLVKLRKAEVFRTVYNNCVG